MCFSAASVFAQENSSIIIEKSYQAIGDKKEIAKIRSIRAFADCTGPNGTCTTEIYSAKNTDLIFKQVRRNGNTYLGQTNGQIFWTTDDKNGDFSIADKKAAFAWRSHDFQSVAMQIAERFRDFVFEGAENFDGKTAVKLRMTDELGSPAYAYFDKDPAYAYFDKDSKLMLGFIIQNPFNEQPELIRTVFNEWTTVGKLKLPSKVTVTDKQGNFVLNFREISFNKIDEKIFSVPAKVRAVNELLELHNQSRAAHFNRDAKLLVSKFADDFTNVGNGKIQQPTREASLNRFQNYLNNSTFLEWDDITPPVIRVSEDVTMAYVIVHKKVRLLAKDASGKEKEEIEIFAWISIYRKIGGKWKLTVVASTNTPEIDK